MSYFRLSPFEMKMLMHYVNSPAPFETTANQDVIDHALAHLADAGLIDGTDFPRATSKGHAWLERALSTPLPVQEWVWK